MFRLWWWECNTRASQNTTRQRVILSGRQCLHPIVGPTQCDTLTHTAAPRGASIPRCLYCKDKLLHTTIFCFIKNQRVILSVAEVCGGEACRVEQTKERQRRRDLVTSFVGLSRGCYILVFTTLPSAFGCHLPLHRGGFIQYRDKTKIH